MWVGFEAADDELKMQVRPAGVACAAHGADHCTLVNGCAAAYIDLGQVGIHRLNRDAVRVLAVVDGDHIAVSQ